MIFHIILDSSVKTTRIILGYLETLPSGIDTMINDVFPKKGRLFETDAIIKSICLTIEILLMQYENINNAASAMQRCSGFN